MKEKINTLKGSVIVVIIATVLFTIYNVIVGGLINLSLTGTVFIEVAVLYAFSLLIYSIFFKKEKYFIVIVPLLFAIFITLGTFLLYHLEFITILTIFIIRWVIIFISILLTKFLLIKLK